MADLSVFPLADDSASDQQPTRIRFVVLGMLTLAMAVAYLMRNIGAINTAMAAEFGYDDKQMGTVLAGFMVGYLWMQIPGGYLGSRFGARLVLPLICVGWSLCALWSGLAGKEHIYWARFAIGVFQGGLIPCSAKVVGDWFPDAERGIASAMVTGGMQAGGLLAMGLTGFLLGSLEWHWRTCVCVYSATGLVWSLAFLFLFRNRPAEHPWINRAELDWISRGRSEAARPAVSRREIGIILGLLLTSVSLWLLCFQQFWRSFGYEFFPTWFPAFLKNSRELSIENASLLTMAPLLAVATGGFVGGLIVDQIYRRTNSKWLSRSGTAMLALSASAACTLAATRANTVEAAVAVITAAAFFAGMAGPCTWAALLDLSGKYTGVVSGIVNLSGVLGAACSPWLVGQLFAGIRHPPTAADGASPTVLSFWALARPWGWNLVLYVIAAAYLLSALGWLFLNSTRSAVERRNSAT